eukprot:scaffold674901_cov67-Prasinocladus_malaysianus.AAC.1
MPTPPKQQDGSTPLDWEWRRSTASISSKMLPNPGITSKNSFGAAAPVCLESASSIHLHGIVPHSLTPYSKLDN